MLSTWAGGIGSFRADLASEEGSVAKRTIYWSMRKHSTVTTDGGSMENGGKKSARQNIAWEEIKNTTIEQERREEARECGKAETRKERMAEKNWSGEKIPLAVPWPAGDGFGKILQV